MSDITSKRHYISLIFYQFDNIPVSQVFMKKDFPQGSDKSGLKTAVESTDQGHIFISYQWDSKSTVLKVRDRLRALGFKTWLDEDDMCSYGIKNLFFTLLHSNDLYFQIKM